MTLDCERGKEEETKLQYDKIFLRLDDSYPNIIRHKKSHKL